MDDRLDDRFAEAVRGALTAQVRASAPGQQPQRAPKPPRRRRVELVWAGVVAAVAVIAIVVGAVSLGQLHRRADPAASEVPQPTQPWGGDCEQMLPNADASDLLGVRASGAGVEDVRVRLAGGRACLWQGTSRTDAATAIQLVAVAASLRGKQPARYCYGSGSGRGTQESCTVDAVAGGTWIAGTLTARIGTTRAETVAAATRLEALLTQRGDGAAVLPKRAADAWRALDCERLGAAASLPSVLGRPRLQVGTANGGSEVPASEIAAWNWTRSTRCLVEDPSEDAGFAFEVDAYPDGAWLQAQAEQNRADLLAPTTGDARVYVQVIPADEGPDGRRVWVISGSNALVIDASSTPVTEQQVRAMVRSLLRVLDAAR